MNYHNIKTDDMLNGDGLRVTCLISGCSLGCFNCQNPQTWDFNSGILFTEETMQEILYDLSKPYIKGLTLSGGHPLDPHNAPKVLEIVKRVKMVFPNMVFPNKDIWIYSGYEWEDIIKDETLREIMRYTDILVDGAYIDELRDISLPFRGSSNQRIIDVPKSLEQNKVILWEEV